MDPWIRAVAPTSAPAEAHALRPAAAAVSVGPPDCFATLAIPDFIRNTGMRDWDMRDREERKGSMSS